MRLQEGSLLIRWLLISLLDKLSCFSRPPPCSFSLPFSLSCLCFFCSLYHRLPHLLSREQMGPQILDSDTGPWLLPALYGIPPPLIVDLRYRPRRSNVL